MDKNSCSRHDRKSMLKAQNTDYLKDSLNTGKGISDSVAEESVGSAAQKEYVNSKAGNTDMSFYETNAKAAENITPDKKKTNNRQASLSSKGNGYSVQKVKKDIRQADKQARMRDKSDRLKVSYDNNGSPLTSGSDSYIKGQAGTKTGMASDRETALKSAKKSNKTGHGKKEKNSKAKNGTEKSYSKAA